MSVAAKKENAVGCLIPIVVAMAVTAVLAMQAMRPRD